MTQGLELRGAVLGKGYRLGRRLATDDTSAYEATHERIPGRFIIRLFPPETLSQPESSSRIQRGARVASLLRDPHAVQVLDCNASGEMPAFVVIERVPGRSLAEVMADDGMLPLPRVVEVVDALAVALAAGHQLGLVHGDIRPAHVFLPTSGHPAARLSGFGWAKELRAAARLPSPSGYLAPEQQFGKVLTLDERTDQFGLAALAYDMIAACLPFNEESTDLADMLSAGHRTPPAVAELVPGLPPAIDEVLRQALTASPAGRFTTVLELAARFREAAGAGPSVASRRDSDGAPSEGRAVREVRAGGFRAAGATPGRPSNDVTEELDLAALSPLSEAERATLEDGDEPEETTAEIGPATGNAAEDMDGDDAQLVLGAASTSSPSSFSAPSPTRNDDAKTQIVRSPFFEEDNQPDPMTESRVDVPATTPRRGIPVGRPPVTLGAPAPGSGKVAGRPGTGRSSAPLQKTMLGLGPDMMPGYEHEDGEPAPWMNLLKNRWAVPAIGAVVLLSAIFALRALVSRPSEGEETVTAEAPPSSAPVASAPGSQTAAPASAPVPAAVPPGLPAAAPREPSMAQEQPAAAPPGNAAPATAAAQSLAHSPITGQPLAPPSHAPSPPSTAPAPTAPRPGVATQHARPIIARVDPLPAQATKPPAATEEGRAAPPAAGGSRPQPPAVTTMARRPPARVGTAARGATSGPAALTTATKRPTADEADEDECSIRISSRPWAEVWLDGKNTGRKTPIDKMKVPCGTRKLELKRPDKDIEQMEMLEVLPGKPYRGSYELE